MQHKKRNDDKKSKKSFTVDFKAYNTEKRCRAKPFCFKNRNTKKGFVRNYVTFKMILNGRRVFLKGFVDFLRNIKEV
jgi:hypothetical protein